MRLLILNGPNMNMLGIRNKSIYGNKSYKELVFEIKKYSKNKNVKTKFYQSNSESKIVDFIQKNYDKFDGMVVNLAAFTHYSIAIGDSFEFVKCPIVEVHMSNVEEREEFRKISVIEKVREYRVIGKGIDSYKEAIDYLISEYYEK